MSRPTSTHRSQAWRVVAAREIVVKLTNRAFIVSTLLMVAIIAGSFGVQVFLATRDQVMTVAVTDARGKAVAEQVGTKAHAEDEHAVVEVKQAADPAAAQQLVRDEQADVYLAPKGDGWELVSRDEPSGTLQRLTREVVSEQALADNAKTAGTTVEALTKGSAVTARSLDDATAERHSLATVLSMVFAVLFLMSSMTFGMQIANSVVEEKSSRVVEIVAAAIPVRQLLAGKVLGNTVMALGQVVLFVAVGLVGVASTSMRTMLPTVANSSGWYVLFFLAGFLALACLWALAGALASRVEDLQSTTGPMTGILMFVYIAGFSAKGAAMTALSFVPVVSTILMPVRLFTGDAAWWEALVSLALTLAFAALVVRFSERLYRRSLLQTNGRLSIKQALALQD